jgi:hypothetical protein
MIEAMRMAGKKCQIRRIDPWKYLFFILLVLLPIHGYLLGKYKALPYHP